MEIYVRIKHSNDHNKVKAYGLYLWRGVFIGVFVNKGKENKDDT